MEHKKITILFQERHIRLNDLILKHLVSETPTLIYSQIATSLQRVKFTNVYIAPDSETINYLVRVENLIEEQNQLYYPYYCAVKKYFRALFTWNQPKIILEQIN